VISDLTMPQMTGIELARAILAVRPGLPVILTTGYLHSEAQQDAQAAGIACVVTKPFEVRELISKVRMALKEPQAVPVGG
jgi:CheY-like chemotaxis protein